MVRYFRAGGFSCRPPILLGRPSVHNTHRELGGSMTGTHPLNATPEGKEADRLIVPGLETRMVVEPAKKANKTGLLGFKGHAVAYDESLRRAKSDTVLRSRRFFFWK